MDTTQIISKRLFQELRIFKGTFRIIVNCAQSFCSGARQLVFRCIQQGFDFFFGFIGEFITIGAEELNAVVCYRIV